MCHLLSMRQEHIRRFRKQIIRAGHVCPAFMSWKIGLLAACEGCGAVLA